ncbi:MAG: hypothetical protein HQ519_06880 [Planctomycetes bacterium]|nr:hypothetical protein [Planctomycetota bacterium]
MMLAFAFLFFGLSVQDLGTLQVGHPQTGIVDSEAKDVYTPTLDSEFSDAINVGIRIPLQVSKGGDYFIQVRSYDFDAYLILRDSNDELLAEDDDTPLYAMGSIADN